MCRPLSSGPSTKQEWLGLLESSPCLARSWLLASFSRVLLGANTERTQAHRRGPRSGATPLAFKQLPPRSRRVPCRRGRHVRRMSPGSYDGGSVTFSPTGSPQLERQTRLHSNTAHHGVTVFRDSSKATGGHVSLLERARVKAIAKGCPS